MDMEITIRDARVVAVKGFIDGQTAPDFQEKVLQAMEEADRVLIDLCQVDFLSSAGLRAMLVTHRATQEKKSAVALVGLSESIKDNMKATGFLSFFEVFDTLDAALAGEGAGI